MTTQIVIRIDEAVKDRPNKLALSEGKTISKIVRMLVEEYIKARNISVYIDNLWNRIGGKLKSKGVTQAAINKAIKASRKKK